MRVKAGDELFWQSKSVLVTGGAGFVGSHLVPNLLGCGARVSVVDNLERGSKRILGSAIDEIDFFEEDLREPSVAHKRCEGMDVVFHLASKVGGIGYYEKHSRDVFEANLAMDGATLDAVLAHGVPYYFYASSAHVYPIELQLRSAPGRPIAESSAVPANPALSYGWAKLLGEKRIDFAIAQGESVRASVARINGAYGPNQDCDFETGSAIPVFIRRALEYPARAPFKVMSTGQERRSYCFVGDVVEAILLSVAALEAQATVGPFNLGSETSASIGDIARKVVALSGKDIPIEFDDGRTAAIWKQELDYSMASHLLSGWRPRVSLDEGLEICYRDIQARLIGDAI